ncbi:MAG: potassium transporter [Candidatus Cloacimonetes bacterium 4572_65]|nr:MAG: potassium transporter [Candidatus Cloacimonetes bacterium 4572_65]
MSRFAIIGMGKFGTAVGTTLSSHEAEVIAIDKDEMVLEEIKDRVTSALCFDATDETALRQSGIDDSTAVIVAIGNNIQANIMTCALLKKIGVGKIYAKVEDDLHRRILKSLGIEEIYFPEEIVGQSLAKQLVLEEINKIVEISSGHVLVELNTPDKYVGKTLQELDLLNKFGLNIVTIKSRVLKITERGEKLIEEHINSLPGANDVFNEDDRIVLLGSKKNVDEFIKASGKKVHDD